MGKLTKTTRLCAIAFAAGSVVAAPAYAVTFTSLATGLGTSLEISAVNGTTAYGSTQYGGTASGGTLFSVTSAGKVTTLHSFAPSTEGSVPNDMLAVDTAGNIYGTTRQDGKFGGGTIFEFTSAHITKILHAFDAAAGDGSKPLQGLARSSVGALYGATSGGAISTNGNVYEVSPSGNYAARYDFKSAGDGHCPFSGVAVDSKGNVYGTVVGNGFGGDPNGAVWKLTPQNKLTPLYLFKDGTDGEYPDQSPIVDTAGNIYGTIITKTDRNGSEVAGYAGAVWKIDATGKFSLLHKFTGTLAHDSTGAIYGATTGNSGSVGGTVYKVKL
jgi:uncharacterized repeat protein (TIGR03803 family)